MWTLQTKREMSRYELWTYSIWFILDGLSEKYVTSPYYDWFHASMQPLSWVSSDETDIHWFLFNPTYSMIFIMLFYKT